MTDTVLVYEKMNLIYHLRTFISGLKYTSLLKKILELEEQNKKSPIMTNFFS